MPSAVAGIGMVMVAAALWATVGVAVQITPAGARIPEIQLAAARTGIAGPMLLAVWALGVGAGRMATLRRLAPAPLVVFACRHDRTLGLDNSLLADQCALDVQCWGTTAAQAALVADAVVDAVATAAAAAGACVLTRATTHDPDLGLDGEILTVEWWA